MLFFNLIAHSYHLKRDYYKIIIMILIDLSTWCHQVLRFAARWQHRQDLYDLPKNMVLYVCMYVKYVKVRINCVSSKSSAHHLIHKQKEHSFI